MKNFYVTPVVLFVATILFSCSKVPKEGYHSEEEHPSWLQLPTSADVRLFPLRDSIWHNKHHRSIIQSALSRFGDLFWIKGVIGHRGSTLVAIIPLAFPNASRVSGFIAFEMDSLLRLKVFDASRPGHYGVSPRSVTNVINALNFKMFGTSLARIDDPCAMSRREAAFLRSARNADPSRKIRLNVRTIEVTTCYSWVSCIGDGAGNCVSNITYHSDCITDVIWTAGEYEEAWWGAPGMEDLSGDGGSGGGYNNAPCEGEEVEEGMEAFVVYEPEKPIVDINDYVDCFTSSRPAQITFYADVPANGSGVKFSKYEKAGHTFLTIEQNINNTIFRRTLGFYPDEAIDPVFVTNGPSILGDNSKNEYDIKLSTNVTGLQLERILNLIREFNPVYDLQRYNCTNFVLDISDAAGLSIKRTVASWGIGSGLNPANFGKDLKSMPGSVLGAGVSPDNTGNCH